MFAIVINQVTQSRNDFATALIVIYAKFTNHVWSRFSHSDRYLCSFVFPIRYIVDRRYDLYKTTA